MLHTQIMDKVPKPSKAFTPRFSQEPQKNHNLLQFFALLYKVDMRNKQEEKNKQKQKEKIETAPTTTSGDSKS